MNQVFCTQTPPAVFARRFFAGPAVAETAFRLAGAVRHTDEERTPVLSLMSDILDDR